jgi:MerR family transcriptional regulator, copper efflux regulator
VRIGKLSQAAGIPAATVRYYEKRGLLRKPLRTASGYRSYPAEAVLELRLIRWAKGVGFTLREVRDLLHVVREHTRNPGDRVRARFDAKLRDVEARMRELAAMRDQLAALAACRCRGECPIIAAAIADRASSKPRKSKT